MSTIGHSDSHSTGNGRSDSSRETAPPLEDPARLDEAPPRVEERATGLFLLGAVLFNPLMLSVFDRGIETVLLGVPLFFVYIFCAWALLIVLLAWTVESRLSPEEPPTNDEPKHPLPPGETP